jgi:hypothetical protein
VAGPRGERAPLTGEGHQLAHHVGGALGGGERVFDEHLVRGGHHVAQELDRRHHGHQHVVEVVRHARREPPHGLHLLRRGELRLEAALLGDVERAAHHAQRPPPVGLDLARGQHPAHLAVGPHDAVHGGLEAARGHGSLARAAHLVAVVGVHGALDVVGQGERLGAAHELPHALVPQHLAAREIPAPEAELRGVERDAQLLLARGERALSGPQHRHVDGDEAAAGLAARLGERGHEHLVGPQLAVGPRARGLVAPGLAGAHDALDGLLRARAIFGGDELERGRAQDVGLAQAGHHAAHEAQAQLGVEAQHHGGQGHQHRAEERARPRARAIFQLGHTQAKSLYLGTKRVELGAGHRASEPTTRARALSWLAPSRAARGRSVALASLAGLG